MRILRLAAAVAALVIVGAGIYLSAAQHPLIAKIEVPSPSSFDPALVKKGAALAAIGNCHTCHTAPGGPDYAGNLAIATPFGTVYSTNITPAPGSGIGHWSEAAFRRAMREGISRRGRHLYPAFPYDHFARLSDEDILALYAFVMTRSPVETYQRENDLPFPLDQRWLLAFWNLLFFDGAPLKVDPQHDREWNRGAYLVEGLGHCGDCHTPRNLLGAEERSHALAGGEAAGWTAPALNAASPAPLPWDAAHLRSYLRYGRDTEHGAAAGPMQPIVGDLARADEGDVRAIAVYLAGLQNGTSIERRQRAEAARARAAAGAPPKPAPGEELGAEIFAGACAACHGGGPGMVPPRGIDLAFSSSIVERDPRDAILVLLDGVHPADESAGPLMPPFAGALTDGQLAAVLSYVRTRFGAGSPWRDLQTTVHEVRQGRQRS